MFGKITSSIMNFGIRAFTWGLKSPINGAIVITSVGAAGYYGTKAAKIGVEKIYKITPENMRLHIRKMVPGTKAHKEANAE
jgi:hypothetical protein